MANLQSRVGRINIRVGGNTQETATLVDSTPDGLIIEKDLGGATNPVRTIHLLSKLLPYVYIRHKHHPSYSLPSYYTCSATSLPT